MGHFNSNAGGQGCHNCGKPEHKKFECPVPSKYGGGGRNAGNRSQPSKYAPYQQDATNITQAPQIGGDVDDSLRMPSPTEPPDPMQSVAGEVFDPREQTKKELVKFGPESAVDHPIRKEFCNSVTQVYTNHFAIKIDPQTPLYEYQILDFPEDTKKRKMKLLIEALIQKCAFLKQNQAYFATDYVSKIISWKKLHELVEYPITKKDPATGEANEWVISVPENDDVTINLLFHFTRVVGIENLEYWAYSQYDADENAIHPAEDALNILVSKAITSQSIPIGPNKFFVKSGHDILGNSPTSSLCTVRGYFYSISPGMGKILLNVNACTSAFFRPMLVSEFLNDRSTFYNEQDRHDALRGLRVYVTYERGPKVNDRESRIKTIGGFGESVERQKFMLSPKVKGAPEQQTTVKAYLENTYNLKLTGSHLRAANLGTIRRPTWFAPETLHIVPYQLYKRPVPDHLTKNMLDTACKPPSASRALIQHEGLVNLGIHTSKGLVSFPNCPPLQIDPCMLQIPCGRLNLPVVLYGNKPCILTQSQWNLKTHRFFKRNGSTPFRIYVLADPRLHKSTVDRYWDEFIKSASKTCATGIFEDCSWKHLETIQPAGIEQGLQVAHQNRANFVLLVLKEKNVAAYSTFKDLTDRTHDMHSICITEKPNMKNGMLGNLLGYFGNVMMKANLKAGGINHDVEGVSDIFKDTLVLGADVTHPGGSALFGTPSIAAIVGSVGPDAGKFLGSMRLQPKENTEMIMDVEAMVLERLKDWFLANNRNFPKNILYYRDGVSEGQYKQVQSDELPQIRRAFEKAAKNGGLASAPKFNLTAIVVAKRHHVRFYPLDRDAARDNGNCQPGTIVDCAVTSPYYADFYLQSHNGLKGTAKPAHYFVIDNEMGLSEKALQKFTHRLCFTYVRATLSVSYAPPAYYADRLCERGRCYLRNLLVPSTAARQEADTRKYGMEQELRKERDVKFSGLRKKNARGWMIRSDEEKEQERKDKKKVEEHLKGITMEMAKKEFHRNGSTGNPWKENVGKTMFWM